MTDIDALIERLHSTGMPLDDDAAAALERMRDELAEVEAALRDVLPYAQAVIGLPRNIWPSDSVILKAEAALASAGEEAGVPEPACRWRSDLDRAEEVRRILIRVAKFTQMKLDMGSTGRKPLQDILDLCAGKVPDWMTEIEAREDLFGPQVPEQSIPTPTGEAQ